MSLTLLPITLTVPANATSGPTVTVSIPGDLASVTWVKIANLSPFLLNITNLTGGADWLEPAIVNAFPVPGLTTAIQVTPYNEYGAAAANALSSIIAVTWYGAGEEPSGTYPVSLAGLTNVGNPAVSIASSLVNDSNPSGTQIIEARPASAAGPYFTATNDGTVTMRGSLTIAYKTGLLPASVQLSDTGNDLALVIGGLAGPGAYGGYVFGAVYNGNNVTPFGIAQSPGVSPLSWIDGTGVLHAIAPVTLAAGNQLTGKLGIQGNAFGASQVYGGSQSFSALMTNIPSSLTLTQDFAPLNCSAPSIGNITLFGFNWSTTATAAGSFFWFGRYVTVGNCLLAIDATAQTFAHHCDGCGHVSNDVPFASLRHGAVGSAVALSAVCQSCGTEEAFNTALTAADEADTSPQGSGAYATTRGAQAALIRALMRALGMDVTA